MPSCESVKTYTIPIRHDGRLRADWEMDESGTARQVSHARSGPHRRIGPDDDPRERRQVSLTDISATVDKLAREYQHSHQGADYQSAVRAVLDQDEDLKAAYCGGR